MKGVSNVETLVQSPPHSPPHSCLHHPRLSSTPIKRLVLVAVTTRVDIVAVRRVAAVVVGLGRVLGLGRDARLAARGRLALVAVACPPVPAVLATSGTPGGRRVRGRRVVWVPAAPVASVVPVATVVPVTAVVPAAARIRGRVPASPAYAPSIPSVPDSYAHAYTHAQIILMLRRSQVVVASAGVDVVRGDASLLLGGGRSGRGEHEVGEEAEEAEQAKGEGHLGSAHAVRARERAAQSAEVGKEQ